MGSHWYIDRSGTYEGNYRLQSQQCFGSLELRAEVDFLDAKAKNATFLHAVVAFSGVLGDKLLRLSKLTFLEEVVELGNPRPQGFFNLGGRGLIEGALRPRQTRRRHQGQ